MIKSVGRSLLVSVFTLFSLVSAFAQGGRFASVRGTVVTDDSAPVDFAAVLVKPSGLYAMTDRAGAFEIGKIPAGEVTVHVEFYGLETYDSTFVASAGQKYELKIVMKETTFRLENVVVTAKKSEAGSSTASEISRQAMDHLQTSSLKDVMTLLPGVSLSNPTLDDAQVITIRNNSGAGPMNSLGTAIIVDGAPMSNNANLQLLTAAQSGNLSSDAGGGSAETGVDIRGLSTDNVESVEVIRGIPSAQYGDLTSGAVIVKSRAGRSPLTVRFKTNPSIYQVSASKGFSLSKKAGDLNISGDYAYNNKSLTASYAYYQRASAKALWSWRPGEVVSMNTSLSFNYGSDIEKLNPDFEASKTQSHANQVGFSFNTNGMAAVNGEWLKNVNWLVSGSYTDKDSHFEDMASNAMNLYSTSMTDGQTYTSVQGLHVYDSVTGEEITNAADAGVKASVLPYSYFYAYDIFGKEINAFAKLNANFSHTWGAVTDRMLVGADFKTDGNLGRGAVYDDDLPPFRNIGNASSGYRKRPYYEIPFVNQIGGYLENYFTWRFAGRDLNLSSGVRYDWVNGLTSLAPRINASVDIFPWMTLRGGYGITSKAPTSIYLNPNYAYLDEINLNWMSVNIPENERLLIASTYVYDATNPDLEIARNRKAEIGLDFTVAKRFNISLTAYDEKMANGYSYGLLPSSFNYFIHQAYKVSQENPGAIPSVTKGTTTRTFFKVYKPGNDIVSVNRGLEYEVDLGRFDAIRTSFYINGAWTRGEYSTRGYTYNTSVNSNESGEYNIAVYEPGRETDINERHITTLRMTHNIPSIGFVITLTTQANWFTKTWTTYRNTYKSSDPSRAGKEYDVFTSYLSYKTGKLETLEWNESVLSDPEFSYLTGEHGDSVRYIVEKYTPFVLFNLNLTKEIGDIMTASFYVNNIFNSRPLYRMKSSGSKVERGIPIFFGFELKVNIK